MKQELDDRVVRVQNAVGKSVRRSPGSKGENASQPGQEKVKRTVIIGDQEA